MSSSSQLSRQAGFVTLAAFLSGLTLSAAIFPALRPTPQVSPVAPRLHTVSITVLPTVFVVHRTSAEATPPVKRTTLSI